MGYNDNHEEKPFIEVLVQERMFFDDLAKRDINALYDYYERHDIATMDCQVWEREAYAGKLWSLVETELKNRHGIVDMETLMKGIREYHQLSIYTVDEAWCIQLFDLDVSANDQVDCIYETSGTELLQVLCDGLEWAKENQRQD